MIQTKPNIFILIFLALTINLTAQEESKNTQQDVLKLFNTCQKIYSIDDELINGYIYPIPNSRIEGHPYLYDDQWNDGTIFIKGKKFTNVFIKFDLILDDVILKAKMEDGVYKLISINKSQVDSFIIGSSLFINSRNLIPLQKKETYYEQIYRGKYFLLKKYEKTFIRMYNELTPCGKYSDLKSNIYLLDNKVLASANRKNTFVKYFEKENQKKIRKYIKDNNLKYKKITSQQLNELMKYCNNIISN